MRERARAATLELMELIEECAPRYTIVADVIAASDYTDQQTYIYAIAGPGAEEELTRAATPYPYIIKCTNSGIWKSAQKINYLRNAQKTAPEVLMVTHILELTRDSDQEKDAAMAAHNCGRIAYIVRLMLNTTLNDIYATTDSAYTYTTGSKYSEHIPGWVTYYINITWQQKWVTAREVARMLSDLTNADIKEIRADQGRIYQLDATMPEIKTRIIYTLHSIGAA